MSFTDSNKIFSEVVFVSIRVSSEFSFVTSWAAFRPVSVSVNEPLAASHPAVAVLSSLPKDTRPVISFGDFTIFYPVAELGSFHAGRVVSSSDLLPPG